MCLVVVRFPPFSTRSAAGVFPGHLRVSQGLWSLEGSLAPHSFHRSDPDPGAPWGAHSVQPDFELFVTALWPLHFPLAAGAPFSFAFITLGMKKPSVNPSFLKPVHKHTAAHSESG